MPGQHEESADWKKRLRCESSVGWDETSEPSFPRRWAVPLVLGAAAYALYRVVQTNVLNSSGATALTVAGAVTAARQDRFYLPAYLNWLTTRLRTCPARGPLRGSSNFA